MADMLTDRKEGGLRAVVWFVVVSAVCGLTGLSAGRLSGCHDMVVESVRVAGLLVVLWEGDLGG